MTSENYSLDKYINKYPTMGDQIKKFSPEICKVLELSKDLKNSKQSTSKEDFFEKFKSYSSSMKYRELFATHTIVFSILFFSGVYSIKSLVMYLSNYHSYDRIDTKEKYLKSVDVYLVNFEIDVLSNFGLKKDEFIQYYRNQSNMEFNERVKLLDQNKVNKEYIKNERIKTTKTQLSKNLDKLKFI